MNLELESLKNITSINKLKISGKILRKSYYEMLDY